MRIHIHVHLSSLGRRQVLEVYQVMSLLGPCTPENHSDYPPVLTAILEIYPIFRRYDVMDLTTSQELFLNIRQYCVKLVKILLLPRKFVNMTLTSL